MTSAIEAKAEWTKKNTSEGAHAEHVVFVITADGMEYGSSEPNDPISNLRG